MLTAAGTAPALAGTPTASFNNSPEFPYAGEKLTLTSTSTPADKIAAWDWDLDNDGSFDDATGPAITHSFAAAGDHPVGLRVRDTDGAEAEVVRKIVVLAPPKAAFTAAPSSPRTGETVSLRATSQPGLRAWDWDLDGDGAYDDASGASTATSFSTAGAHRVGLKVTDRRNGTDTATQDINVTAPPPLPAPPFSISKQTPAVGQPVVFDATPVDKGHGGAKDHRWDLDGDGVFERDTNRAPAVEVTFGTAGPIKPALQVAFADGSTVHYEASMQVGPGAAPAGCSPYCHVTFPFEPAESPGCATSVEVGLVLAEADCFHRRGHVYSTAGRVRVNGLDLYPITGGRIEIDTGAQSLHSSGGLVTLQYGEFTLAYLHDIEWDDLGGADGVAEMPNVIPGPTTSVEGFGITGRLGVTFREHRATFDAHIEMPDGVGGFDAQLRLTVTAEHPATLDELRVSLPVGELQDTLPIDHLLLDYEAAANRWLGDVGVSIGDYDVGAAIGFHTIPQAGLDQLRASLGGLNVSIYAGVFLQEIRFDYTNPPPELGGGITLSYGPEYYDRSLVAVDGNFHLGLSDPVVIRIDGEGRILGLKVAAVDSRYSTDGNFSFDASVRVGVNPLGPPRPPWWEDSETPPFARLVGEVHGWIDGPHDTFNASGAGQACFGGCFGATMLMSSTGVAGCAHLGAGSVGGGYTWVTRRFDWLAGACDLGAWTVARSSGARAAQAERTLTLPPGLSVAAFKVTGEGAAPRVTVTGPKGERILTPPGVNGAKTANSLVTMDPAGHTTYVAVGSPSAGTWKITAEPGSAPIAAASSARALPDVSVAAKLGGKGMRRRLRYRVKPLPGQTVVFSERSRTLTHEIGRARRASGTLRFAPGVGPAGARRIVAQVSQGGLPRDEITVARYRAPRPARPGRPGRVAFKRRARSLRVRWRPSSGHPRAYEVRMTTINRREELFRVPARRRRITLRDIRPADRVRVTVTPLTAEHRRGPARRAVARPRGRDRR
ncbi:MAG: PKD domain-containing protein [Actinomycetota bacterium]|nr:PKD domain-containing protein [Actinomycetota bacterium]